MHDALEDEKETVDAQAVLAQGEMNRKEFVIVQYKKYIDTLTNDNASLKSRLSTSMTENAELRERMTGLQQVTSSFAELQVSLDVKETENAKLRERMFGLRESFTELQVTLEEKEMENAQLREHMTGLQCNIDELEKANHEENNQLISRTNRSAHMIFPASRSPWNISDEEQTGVLNKHLSQCSFSENIHPDIMMTEFRRDDDECVAIACNNVADTINTQMWEIHKEALRFGVSETPRDLSKELITEILGCSLISAAIEIVKDCCSLSPLAIIVLWNNLNIDHKTSQI